MSSTSQDEQIFMNQGAAIIVEEACVGWIQTFLKARPEHWCIVQVLQSKLVPMGLAAHSTPLGQLLVYTTLPIYTMGKYNAYGVYFYLHNGQVQIRIGRRKCQKSYDVNFMD